MFDALANYIVYLETCLHGTTDPNEVSEITRLMQTAKKLQSQSGKPKKAKAPEKNG